MTKLLCQNVLQIDLHTLEYVKIVKCYAHHIHHMVTHCSEMSCQITSLYASVVVPTRSHCITVTSYNYKLSIICHWSLESLLTPS